MSTYTSTILIYLLVFICSSQEDARVLCNSGQQKSRNVIIGQGDRHRRRGSWGTSGYSLRTFVDRVSTARYSRINNLPSDTGIGPDQIPYSPKITSGKTTHFRCPTPGRRRRRSNRTTGWGTGHVHSGSSQMGSSGVGVDKISVVGGGQPGTEPRNNSDTMDWERRWVVHPQE